MSLSLSSLPNASERTYIIGATVVATSYLGYLGASSLGPLDVLGAYSQYGPLLFAGTVGLGTYIVLNKNYDSLEPVEERIINHPIKSGLGAGAGYLIASNLGANTFTTIIIMGLVAIGASSISV
jgi:hypothetical protein